MSVSQIIFLFLLLFPVPAAAGCIFRNGNYNQNSLPYLWVSGQILLWAGFQFICVPLILLEYTFRQVVLYYNIFSCIAVLAGLICLLIRRPGIHLIKATAPAGNTAVSKAFTRKSCLLLWGIFALLLLVQLVAAVFFAYEEGDDAFYVAISTISVDSDSMYSKLPYTGGSTGLDARHGLAPFPVWISYLAKMTGMPAVTAAQIAVPLSLILMTYTLYYLIGRVILSESLHMLPLFMILIALLVLWGGYSTYSAENFLLVRTAQGKAVIANIIFPFLFLQLLLLLEKLQHNKKAGFSYWMLLALTMVAGCLCSTLGTVLTCMLLGVTGLCAAVSYRRWRLLIPLIACCIIPLCYAFLYLVQE